MDSRQQALSLVLLCSFALSVAVTAEAQAPVAGRVSRDAGSIDATAGSAAGYRACALRGDCCAESRLYFNGRCRKAEFFERFLSTDASLLGVGGPRIQDADHDTGVVVVEEVERGQIQLVYLLPDKRLPGEPLSASWQYRADYPVVGIVSRSLWIDPQGFLNSFAADAGPVPLVRGAFGNGGGPGFDVTGWAHRAYTASGWCEVRSDLPGTTCAIASGSSSQDYCMATAASDAATFDVACKAGSGAGAAVLGIGAGVGGFILGAGWGAVPAATGTAIFFGGLGYAVCGSVAGWLEATGAQECMHPPAVTTPTLGHYEAPEGVDLGDLDGGDCPSGFVEYYGSALYCPEGSSSYVDDDGGVVVTAARCYNVAVNGECVPTSAV